MCRIHKGVAVFCMCFQFLNPNLIFALDEAQVLDELKALRQELSTMGERVKSLENKVTAQQTEIRNHEEEKATYEARIRDLEGKVDETTSGVPSQSRLPAADKLKSLPDISVIANIQSNLGTKGDTNEGKIRMDESELVIGGYLYPNIKGDATVAWEQEYKDNNEVETEVALEEGYISFLDLPFNAQAELGRKFIGFGKLNPVHAHTWSFVDKPLVLENFLGEESWNDDGVNLNFLIPNPWDWYIKSGIGFYNGKDVEGDNLIDWNGRLLVHRTSLNVPFSDNFDTSIGYSRAWDEKNSTTLQGADVSLTYRFDDSYRKLRWQNEVLTARIDSIGIPDQDGEQERYPFGAYSLLSFALDKNWSLGARYDWSETPVDDQNHSWASSAFVTYHFTESLLARVQYRHLEQISEPDPDNTIFLQVIWGIGPHSHRLQD